MAADHYIMDADMKTVADAIRAKAGTTEPLVFPDGMKNAIDGIKTGVELISIKKMNVALSPGSGNVNLSGNARPRSNLESCFIYGDSGVKYPAFNLQSYSEPESVHINKGNLSDFFSEIGKFMDKHVGSTYNGTAKVIVNVITETVSKYDTDAVLKYVNETVIFTNYDGKGWKAEMNGNLKCPGNMAVYSVNVYFAGWIGISAP